jgi:methionyl-tRNA formyltransferase
MIAVPSLERLARAHEVCVVLTGGGRPAGRGKRIEQAPVRVKAIEMGLHVVDVERIDATVSDAVRDRRPELLVVVAFSRIFKKGFLDIFPFGGINLHPSILPRHRGPSPITAAILCGDTETGVSIQRLALKFDTGDILAQVKVPLSGVETTGSLSERLSTVGAELLSGVLEEIAQGRPRAVPQKEEDATYCRLVKKEDGRIDWTDSAVRIERMVRAYDPWPRAFTGFKGMSLTVLKSTVYTGTLGADGFYGGVEAQPGTVMGADSGQGFLVRTGDGVLAVQNLQLEFKKAMDWRAFRNGHPGVIGTRLGG